MKNKPTKYSSVSKKLAQAIDQSEVIKDFLPAPEELASQEKTVKVTLALTLDSFNFFKTVAQKNHVPYQKMIRQLLASYSRQYQKN